jgi:hypothetical protein
MDKTIELIKEYLGDLSEGPPPTAPSLEVCQAIYWLIDDHINGARARRSQGWADRMDANYGGPY